MDQKTNKAYCPVPFNSVTVEATGRLSLCCESVADYTFPGGHKHVGQVASVDEHFNGQYMDSVRSAMLAGEKLKECKVCYKLEAAGRVSDRQRHGWSRPLLTDGPEIKFVDFKLGNKCNLRCKMCWPHNSSELMKEWHDLGWMGDDPMAGGREEFYDGYMQEDFAWPTRPENIDKLMKVTHLLEHMKFTGGEPMLNPQLFQILQHCVDEGTAGGITLRVVTNCTKIHPRFLDLAKEFKSLALFLSIDGVGRTYEYIRYPANWNDVSANAARYASWYRDGLVQGNLQVHSVISVFNLHQIPELCKWVRATLDGVQCDWPCMAFLELDRPEFMDWRHAPPEVRERVARESLELSKSPDPSLSLLGKELGRMLDRQGGAWPTDDTHRRLREFATQQDGLRGIDIADYVPALVSTIRPL